jgi:hypothetical protein
MNTMSKLFKYSLFIVMCDMITTYAFLHYTPYGYESNPGAALILASFGIIGLAAFSLSLVIAANRYLPCALWLFVIVNTPAVINNIQYLYFNAHA